MATLQGHPAITQVCKVPGERASGLVLGKAEFTLDQRRSTLAFRDCGDHFFSSK